jgi:glycolate oxidase iron-sulfur subunit
MIKDYGFLLRNEPAYAAKAARVSVLAKDVTEFLGQLDQPEPINPQGTAVACYSARGRFKWNLNNDRATGAK